TGPASSPKYLATSTTTTAMASARRNSRFMSSPFFTDLSVLIAGKVVNGNFKPGFQTPAGCYGNEMVLEIEGVERRLIE
ncbi:MAG TPA: hypothetical protein VLC28_03940, partial [Flavitalea sp.]|nr:hypothetical protein [Flavitalea sp.]